VDKAPVDKVPLETSNPLPPVKRPAWHEPAEVPLMNALGRSMQSMSWSGCRLTGAWLGLFFFNAIRRRREVAISNVRLAFPHLSEAAARQIARRSAQNAGMTMCEFFRMPAASPQEISEYIDVQGLEHVQQGLEQGRGVLLLTAHLGNWELMGARAAQEFALTVVARPNSNSGVQQYIDEARMSVGIKVISKFDTGRASIGVLRANKTLAILPDQHAGPDGVLLPFFGHHTRFVSSLARIALLSKAPVVPAFGVRRKPWLADGRIVARVSPPLPPLDKSQTNKSREELVLEGTRQVIATLEDVITRYSDQWLWMPRRWRPADFEAATQNSEAAAGA